MLRQMRQKLPHLRPAQVARMPPASVRTTEMSQELSNPSFVALDRARRKVPLSTNSTESIQELHQAMYYLTQTEQVKQKILLCTGCANYHARRRPCSEDALLRRGRTTQMLSARVSVMDTLDWLLKRRLQSVLRREHDWVFEFDGPATLAVECLWRLLDDGRIRLTSEDDAQQFGLPAPVVGAEEAGRCLVGSSIQSVDLRAGTLDLELRFNTGHALQIIPDSAGYEAWKVVDRGREYIAVGGGELAIFDGGAAGG
jgi:Family of unknown function (DUF6188)